MMPTTGPRGLSMAGDYVLGDGSTQQSMYGHRSQGFSFAPTLPRELRLGVPSPSVCGPWAPTACA